MTQEELLEKIRGGQTMMIICMSVKGQELQPGYIRHYHCGVCRTELQVSPSGRQNVIAGALALCNTCALDVLAARGKNGGATDVILGPDTVAGLQRRADAGDAGAAEMLRRAREGK